jgi:RND superfamily putative drug exporter
MLRLERTLRRRRWLVLGAWIAAVVLAVPFAARQSEHLTGGGYGVPGSQSDAVTKALPGYGDAVREGLGAVVSSRAGLAQLQDATRPTPGATLTREGKRDALAALQRAPDRPAVVALSVRSETADAIDEARDLRDRLEGTGVHVIGQGALWAGLQDRSKHDMERSERAGFPLVALVLLAVFGSLAAASLPLALGVVSVLVTGALIFFLSQAMDMSVFVTNMASMIGIGVAVDYSLFVLARYREEVHAGVSPSVARGRALATSGLAVIFSGATVMVSLAGLFLVNTTAMRSMAIGAILVVAVSVVAAATLLPALMSVLGHRAYTRGRVFSLLHLVASTRRPRRRGTHPGFWRAWTDRVMRRPALSAVLATAALVALAAPALSLETGNGALRQLPADDPTRQGIEAAGAVAGPGASTPVRVIATVRDGRVGDGENASALRVLQTRIGRDAEVARVSAPITGADARSALISATARHDAESAQAKALVERLRSLPAGERLTVAVGGPTAVQVDFDDRISGSMWKIALFVLVLSYVVLLFLLRSAILPLKAALMNLLSVGAAYGVLVGVFQWGWLEWAGFEPTGHLDAIIPPILLAVVFGLSMDYEVFLLSRIRERFEATRDTRRAVGEGLASSARTITSAAVIMVAVFAVFASTGLPAIQQLGLGCAVAIAIDATIVRLVLVPAAMALLGRWNWWLPRPLARVLPRADFERLPATASGD